MSYESAGIFCCQGIRWYLEVFIYRLRQIWRKISPILVLYSVCACFRVYKALIQPDELRRRTSGQPRRREDQIYLLRSLWKRQYHRPMRGSTTQQVADEIGISKRQLLRWLYGRKVPEPRRERIGEVEVRIWSAGDVQRARKFKERSSVTRVSRTGA